MLKLQLYKLILVYKPFTKKFSMEKFYSRYGHTVLYLPSSQPDLIHIKLGAVKTVG
jgi:hypothetical protein